FSGRRRHTRFSRDWSSDVCSSDLCPAPGHQLGFNELKVIECAALLRGIAGLEAAAPSFADALRIERVIHAIADSAMAGGKRVSRSEERRVGEGGRERG